MNNLKTMKIGVKMMVFRLDKNQRLINIELYMNQIQSQKTILFLLEIIIIIYN